MSLAIAGVVEAARALNKKPEGFSVNEEGSPSSTVMRGVIHLVNLFMSLFAFYLAFKCINKGKNAFAQLLGACCCGVFYIAYALASGCL